MHHLDNDGGGTLNINFNCSASTGTVIDTIANMFEVCGSIGGGGGEWYGDVYGHPPRFSPVCYISGLTYI